MNKPNQEQTVNARALIVLTAILGISALVGDYLIDHPYTPTAVTEAAETDSDLTCYEPYGSNVEPQFLADHAFIKVNYLTHPLPDGSEGAAMFIYDPETGISACELWVPVPMHVLGDPAMDTLGHELLHCLTGYFHE